MATRRKTTTRRPATRKATARKPATARKRVNEKQIIGFLFGICLLSTLFLFLLFWSRERLRIPDIRSVAYYRPLQTSFVYDRHNTVIDRIFKENRTVIPLKGMSPFLVKGFVAAEDSRFYDHPGLDFLSVLRAALINVKRGKKGQGGSTITQQVARSLLLTPEKSYLRKVKEAILAWRIDTLLSKDEILYIYLNQIYLGEGAYGVEAAASTYFNKRAKDLSLGECAILAGLPQAPSRYSPLKHLDRAKERQRYVLNRMAAAGVISKQQANRAFGQRLTFHRPVVKENRENGFFLRVVKERAEKLLGVKLDRAGMRIHTTLDSFMQKRAVAALRKGVKESFNRQPRNEKKRKVPQGALVALESCSSRVRALVGGVDFAVTPYGRATRARRPAGSVFKPLIFAAALEKGWKPSSVVIDAPIRFKGKNGTAWHPKNSSGTYHGPVTLATALAHSYNSVAVRLLKKVGVKRVHQLARKSGIHSQLTPDLSLALGAVDVSLLEMTAAYSPFVCGGMFRSPVFIDRIENSNGQEIITNRGKPVRAFSARTAASMKRMLYGVVETGTGRRARGLGVATGGKTGTTNDNRDAWFVGFTSRLLTGVWMGHDDNQSLGRGESGGRAAAPIWLAFMRQAMDAEGGKNRSWKK